VCASPRGGITWGWRGVGGQFGCDDGDFSLRVLGLQECGGGEADDTGANDEDMLLGGSTGRDLALHFRVVFVRRIAEMPRSVLQCSSTIFGMIGPEMSLYGGVHVWDWRVTTQ